MRPDLLLFAAELAKRGEAFVFATVVRRAPPSSARVGDAALVTQDGVFHGWLGGSCTQPTVVREALRALAEGVPRLIALSAQPGSERRDGVAALPNTCFSGGSVDVYIEPVLPAPHLAVFGASPVAQALARLGKAMKFHVDVVDPDADRAAFPDADRVLAALGSGQLGSGSSRPEMLAVVATMGQRDEEATAAAIALEPAYLGLVASRRRFAQIRERLTALGIAQQALACIASPTGLDIGAHTPEEIAVSILAQIVQVRRAAVATRVAEHAAVERATEARDPICGMMVKTAGARHQHQHAGRTYYFCCDGCRELFAGDPDRYAAVAEGEASA